MAKQKKIFKISSEKLVKHIQMMWFFRQNNCEFYVK